MRHFLPLLLAAAGYAAGVRPVPPPGVLVPDRDRVELEAGLAQLSASIEKLRGVDQIAAAGFFGEHWEVVQ